MKHLKLIRLAKIIALICLPFVFLSCHKDDPKETSEINYHFATIAEGQQLLAANTEYYNSLNQNNIDWRMRKTGSSLYELIFFAQTCVRDFNDDEKAAITRAVTYIETRLNDMGASLPFPEDIAFVKTTMEEERGAGAYTHKTEVYICDRVLQFGIPREGDSEAVAASKRNYFNHVIAHESRATLRRSVAKCTAS